jgi:hypothetical protein
MKKTNIGKIAGIAAAVAISVTPQAKADFIFNLDAGNSAISGFSGPYAQVAVHLTDSTHATITFTSLLNSGNIYLLGDGGTVGVNVNAASWTLGAITGGNAGTGFSGGQYSDGGSGNEDGWGSFNQTINSFDGFTHSSDNVSFTVTDSSSTWASASDVLTANGSGFLAAAHIFVTTAPADANNSALVTGFAAGTGVPVPEPTTVLAGLLLLLPLGASTIRVMRRGNRFA